MAKEKLITITQLKKSVQNFTPNEFITLISEIAQACPQAKEFLTLKFASPENATIVLEKYKKLVSDEFFPMIGFGGLDLRKAKKAISDFKKICTDKAMGIDITLFYVENCVEFTAQFGDINESFYDSAISVYAQVVEEINSGGESLYKIFADRLKAAAEDACQGWGFQDDMLDLYYQIYWLEDDED